MTMKLNKPDLKFQEFIGQPTTTDNTFGYFRIKDIAIGKTVKPLSAVVRCPIVTRCNKITVMSRLGVTKRGFVTVCFFLSVTLKHFKPTSADNNYQ